MFYALALTDLFLSYSHLLDFVPGAGRVPLGSILRIVVFLYALLSGDLVGSISSPFSVRMLLFTGWLMVTTLLSTWKSGSVSLLTHFWFPSFMGFLAVIGIFKTTKAVRQGVIGIGFASATITVLSFLTGKLDVMRFDLDSPSLGNPNDLALALLIGLPGILLFLLINNGRRYLSRAILILSIILAVRIVANTASRGGLLTLFAYAMVLFFSVSAMNKLKVALVILAIGAIFFVSAPKTALLRYQTILPSTISEPGDDPGVQESAQESMNERRGLLLESLKLTVLNPVFGVGPGTYQSAAADVSARERHRADWHESHNSYTQVSSETGVPGFILYLGLMVGSFSAAYRVRRRTEGMIGFEPVHQTATCLLLMLTCFALNSFFESMAYLPMFPFLLALVGSLERNFNNEIASSEQASISQDVSSVPQTETMFD
jgi:O-antigen ligase